MSPNWDQGMSMSMPIGGRPVASLPDICNKQTSPWAPGQAAFVSREEQVGLTAVGAEGTRISVADYDGDGWPDLMVRRVSAPGDDFAPGGKRGFWLLRNKGDGTFEDTTQASGLLARRDGAPTGRPAELIAFGDVDNDGDLDAVTAFSNTSAPLESASAEVMLNKGDGTFELGPLELNAFRQPNVNITRGGLSLVDVDRDGFLDAWVTQGGTEQDRLYRGNGLGSLIDITEQAKLITAPWQDLAKINAAQAHTNSWGANACDLNGDGSPELLSASYGRAPNHLWLGALGADGAVSYTNGSIASGYAFDARGDWSDNESARCHCQLNPQDDGCQGVPAPRLIRCQSQDDAFRWRHSTDREPFRLGGNSGTTVCADLNNDGALDLLTTEIVHWDVGSSSDPSEILYNDGAAKFTRPGPMATGVFKTRAPGEQTWDDGDITAAVLDFDNDGRQDIYIGTTDYPGARGHLYHQKSDGTFEEVAITEGIDHKSSHGVGLADFDGDGDLDLVLGHSRNRCSSGDHCYPTAQTRYFENTIGSTRGNWFQLDLEGGAGSNFAAIGARVTVEAGGLKQVQEVDGGHGHYAIQRERMLHFGIGAACEAQVTVRWPNKELTTERVTLKPGYRYKLVQGQLPLAIERVAVGSN